MFFAITESHLNSRRVSGASQLHEQNLLHPLPIITVLVFVCGSFMNSNLHIVTLLDVPHNLRYSWFLTCKKLPRSVGKICNTN